MRVLVVDDEESMRHMISVILKKEGYTAVTSPSADEALKLLELEDFDFILSDIKMPGLGGTAFLKELRARNQSAPVIMMSAYGSMDSAIECMKLGAYDYISKPFKPDEVVLTLKKCEERERLKSENKRLRAEAERNSGSFYGEDPLMREVHDLIDKVAAYDTTVLITGETGTGKELVARAIHQGGARREGPFIAVNCGAIPANLMESELFGHVKGAFTGAVASRPGLFKEADGGTIFLDEIGELPRELQVKLLRVLQESEVRSVGDSKSIKVNARILAATVKDLEAEVSAGNFREDLYYRLNVIVVRVPPLRERAGDIEELSKLFVRDFAARYLRPAASITKEAMAMLRAYPWPGNVRELENIIERAVILEDGEEIGPDRLPIFKEGPSSGKSSASGRGSAYNGLSIKKGQEEMERTLIQKALDATGGNRTRAAELLEISHRALLYKIKNYEL
ncbi:Type IV fimbriae expression regulatory protein PilR [hydrothermal vent metagenome]|uniref:Type IV fimbriae expression regulatory protein PilR n=1 Tax=hydrothermal vent metagenome TaxID=652676 RepID=A0A3B0VCZ0_9ZZZZ